MTSIAVRMTGSRRSLYPVVTLAVALLHMSTPLHADSFVLTSGKVIEGTVAGGSDISLFIKDANGLLESVLLTSVAEVRVTLSSGEEVVGRLIDFQDGTYEMATDKWLLFVKDGNVIQSVQVQDATAPAIFPNAGGPAISVDTEEPAKKPEPTDEETDALTKRATM